VVGVKNSPIVSVQSSHQVQRSHSTGPQLRQRGSHGGKRSSLAEGAGFAVPASVVLVDEDFMKLHQKAKREGGGEAGGGGERSQEGRKRIQRRSEDVKRRRMKNREVTLKCVG